MEVSASVDFEASGAISEVTSEDGVPVSVAVLTSVSAVWEPVSAVSLVSLVSSAATVVSVTVALSMMILLMRWSISDCSTLKRS